MSTYVLVPAYNEGEVIRQTVEGLLQAGYEVIVVDDGSTDNTEAQLRNLPIHHLRHIINLGQGAALQTGMRYAQSIGAEMLVHFDADGQHCVKDIARILAPIQAEEADIVLGSRFLGESSDDLSASRRMLLKVAVLVNGLLTGLWLSDAHNGLRAMNAKTLSCIQLQENGMAHATEILSEIRRHSLRYTEVAVQIRYSAYSRAKGQSGWNAFNILSDLLLHKLLSR